VGVARAGESVGLGGSVGPGGVLDGSMEAVEGVGVDDGGVGDVTDVTDGAVEVDGVVEADDSPAGVDDGGGVTWAEGAHASTRTATVTVKTIARRRGPAIVQSS
jgi:hypothetical protein